MEERRPPAPALDMSGWLLKKGAVGIVRVYKRRWFRFSASTGTLEYFESSSDTESLGQIVVTSECEARLGGDSSSDLFAFQLATPTRVYLLRAETLESLHYWMAGLAQYIKAARPSQDEFVHVEQNSSDYIVIDLHTSQVTDAARLGHGSTDPESDSQTDSEAAVPPEVIEAFRRVQLVESAPRSGGLLGTGAASAASEDSSPLAKATRVISCLRTLLGPPPRADTGMNIGEVLRNLSLDQVEWLAPLLLALEKEDVTEVILHLAASGSSVLRVTLIALHSSGFTATAFARASVNNLYEITDAERNTLRLSEFLQENGDGIVVGKQFPVQMVRESSGFVVVFQLSP